MILFDMGVAFTKSDEPNEFRIFFVLIGSSAAFSNPLVQATGVPSGQPVVPPGTHPHPHHHHHPSSAGAGAGGSMRRKNASRETTAALKTWLFEHRKNPYPTKGEKIMLAIITKMSVSILEVATAPPPPPPLCARESFCFHYLVWTN